MSTTTSLPHCPRRNARFVLSAVSVYYRRSADVLSHYADVVQPAHPDYGGNNIPLLGVYHVSGSRCTFAIYHAE